MGGSTTEILKKMDEDKQFNSNKENDNKTLLTKRKKKNYILLEVI